MNVTIVDYKQRFNEDGEPFNALILEGELTMVQSTVSKNFYATAKRTSISSTFNDERCKQLIGTQIPGTIEKVECDPYQYVIPETNEEITLRHRYEYRPESQERMEAAVFEHNSKNADPTPELA
jgi:Ca2+-dependent lipid-binding protein